MLKIISNSNLATFCDTFGTLLKSGISIDEALEVVKSTLGNYYYKKSLRHISIHASQGNKLSDSFNEWSHLYPHIMTSMIMVGERSGKLEETLFYLSEYFEGEVETATKRLTTAIEPILLIFIGLSVGILALSIITPIYKITGNISR